MTVVLDDHLLRDWLSGPDDHLAAAIGAEEVATTNLWYVRLCKSAARATGGALLRGWTHEQRQVLISRLVELPTNVHVVAMEELAWRMGQLMASEHRLSTLSAEAVAAALTLDGRILVSARDEGPRLRECCTTHNITYTTLQR